MAGDVSRFNGKKGGRPKGSLATHTLETQELKKALVSAYHVKANEINEALMSKALTGDIPAIKEIHDRVYGKAPQAIEMSGKDGKELFPEPNEKIKELAKALNEIYKRGTSTGL